MTAAIRKVTAETLRQWIARDEAVVYDVREVWEFNEGHIAGSTNVPLSGISGNNIILPDNSVQRVVLYCKAGVRSQMAAEKLFADGVDRDLWNYAGGWMDWDTLGYEKA
jgi:rhodanese-related sulfurtransferase